MVGEVGRVESPVVEAVLHLLEVEEEVIGADPVVARASVVTGVPLTVPVTTRPLRPAGRKPAPTTGSSSNQCSGPFEP